jgi:hypothetical protein
MNAQRTIAGVAGFMLLTAIVSFAQQVKTDFDRGSDFGHYRAYSREKVQTQGRHSGSRSVRCQHDPASPRQ